MKKLMILIAAATFIFAGAVVLAQDPNEHAGMIPVIEDVCGGPDAPGFGLCVAACESALIEKDTTSKAFERVRANYIRKTGQELPCMVVDCLDPLGFSCGSVAMPICQQIDAKVHSLDNMTCYSYPAVSNLCTGEYEPMVRCTARQYDPVYAVGISSVYESGDMACFSQFGFDGLDWQSDTACLDGCGWIRDFTDSSKNCP